MKALIKSSLVLMMALHCTLARAQGTFTAATCNRNDVNALINGPTHVAVDGDTIRIPAGSCTWTQGVIVPSAVGITITGTGTPNSTPGTTGASSSCAQTQITDNSGMIFQMTPNYGVTTSRLSCMTVIPNNSYPNNTQPIWVVGSCTASGCPNFRLDNITVPSAWADAGVADATFAVVSNMFGVADHNSVGDTKPTTVGGVDLINVGHGHWLGVGDWGDNSWASPDTFGTNQAFYLENNKFVWSFGTDVDTPGTDYGGGRFVCRFNTFNPVTLASACTNHGLDTNGRNRGGRQAEMYRNSFSCLPGADNCAAIVGSRSGAWMIFDNSFSSGDTVANTYITMTVQRPWRPNSPFGSCSGDSPWDDNDTGFTALGPYTISNNTSGTTTIIVSGSPGWGTNQFAPGPQVYMATDISQTVSGGPTGNHPGIPILRNTSNTLTTSVPMCSSDGSTCPVLNDQIQIMRVNACADQSTRGQGQLVQGQLFTPVLRSTGSPGPVNNALDPTYEANNSGAPHNGKGGGDPGIIANRDFYFEAVNQAAQTSPTSPFNGISGTGHGRLANRPSTCTPRVGYWATDQGIWNQSGIGGQGELFVCTGVNTWTLYYTPYTYPHPLTKGPPLPPANIVGIGH